MAVGIEVFLPDEAPREMYVAVSNALEAKGNPPGMIFHHGGVYEGRIRVVDVWESREHYERFRTEWLIPTMVEVMGQEAVDQLPDVNPAEYEVLDHSAS